MDNLNVEARKVYKTEGENGNEEGRNRSSFSRLDLFFINNKHATCFYLRFTKKRI